MDTYPVIIVSIMFICLFTPSIMLLARYLQRTLPKTQRLGVNRYQLCFLFTLSVVIVISMYNPTTTFALYGLTPTQFNVIRLIAIGALITISIAVNGLMDLLLHPVGKRNRTYE